MSAVQWAAREAASNVSSGKDAAHDETTELLEIVSMLLAAGSDADLSANPRSVILR